MSLGQRVSGSGDNSDSNAALENLGESLQVWICVRFYWRCSKFEGILKLNDCFFFLRIL